MTPDAVDRMDRLLALVRRCDRLIGCHTDSSLRSPELTRAIAELRLALTADARLRGLDRELAVSSIAGLRLGLPTVRTALLEAQRSLLAPRVA